MSHQSVTTFEVTTGSVPGNLTGAQLLPFVNKLCANKVSSITINGRQIVVRHGGVYRGHLEEAIKAVCTRKMPGRKIKNCGTDIPVETYRLTFTVPGGIPGHCVGKLKSELLAPQGKVGGRPSEIQHIEVTLREIVLDVAVPRRNRDAQTGFVTKYVNIALGRVLGGKYTLRPTG